MNARVSIRQKRKEAPEWVFRWKPLGNSSFPNWFALVAVGGVFALALTSLRLKVTPPVRWASRKAVVIHVADDADGRALARKAREGGPFPSRFDPADWAGAGELEKAAFAAAAWSPAPHVPRLRSLPEKEIPPVHLAAEGEAVLPRLTPVITAVPTTGALELAPVLHALAGIAPASIPDKLPPYEGPIDKTLTAEPLRFLIRLDPEGHVIDCVSLAGSEKPGIPPLELWLRGVTFRPQTTQSPRWIALSVGFSNQTSDGTHPR